MEEITLLNNRYQLEKTLGSGGMSVVYRAHDLMLERTVAIKVLREDFTSDPGFRERFHQEAKAAANLSHQNIVTIHDFGLDSGKLFIVMEYVPGSDLKSILQRRGRIPIEEAVALMVQACAGVGYAHRAGLVHCDIKPHNMIVTPDQRLKVADFGIARALASIHPDEKTNIVWGSPQYFAPEQASGNAPSPASDVYSLGVILYEMLTGRLPFIGTTASELARMHREDPPTPPSQINPAIPSTLEQIILKVLSKEPSSRYRSADQMGRVLLTYMKPSQPEPPLDVVHNTLPPAKPILATNQPTVQSEPVLTQSKSNASPAPIPIEKSLPDENPLNVDWGTWGLAFLALIAVGGLIPFWLWIYLLYNPPIR
jgi:serine/threonine protein kinase